MRAIKKIFGVKEQPAGAKEIQVMEVKLGGVRRGVGEIEPIYVKSMELQSPADVGKAEDELRAGNVMILDISSFMNQDVEELKHTIDQLKGICRAIGGDMGRLGDSMIVATPHYVVLQFKKPAV